MNIAIIGAGKLGSALAKALTKKDMTPSIIIGKNNDKAKILGEKLFCDYSNDINKLKHDIDLVFICVNDDAIADIAKKIPKNICVCHTSGTKSINILSDFDHYANFYPLQSFSHKINVDFDQIPIFIEASDEETYNTIKNIASVLSPKVEKINSAQRTKLHIAAVFVCNFTNHLYSIGFNIMQEADLDFAYLLPLIKETARKLEEGIPRELQTGPAERNDTDTINKHIDILKDDNIKEIYKLLSENIINEKSNK